MKVVPVSSAKFCKFLEKERFESVRQRGSHRFYRHADGRTTVVPIHPTTKLGKGLIVTILKEIKISRDRYLKGIKKI